MGLDAKTHLVTPSKMESLATNPINKRKASSTPITLTTPHTGVIGIGQRPPLQA